MRPLDPARAARGRRRPAAGRARPRPRGGHRAGSLDPDLPGAAELRATRSSDVGAPHRGEPHAERAPAHEAHGVEWRWTWKMTRSVEPDGGARPAGRLDRGGGGEALARGARRCSCCTTSKATRTRRSPTSWASPRAARNRSCSRRARSCAPCWRIDRWCSEYQVSDHDLTCLTCLLERLAALGDEEPTAVEAAHLAACAECARERSAYRTLVAMARTERDGDLEIPLTRWDAIAGAMATE